MKTVVVNARGEPFDVTGAEEQNYEKYLADKKPNWYGGHEYTSEAYKIRLPSGKIIMPEAYPFHVGKMLKKRLTSSLDKFMSEVGFRVPAGQEQALKGCWEWDVGVKEKSVAKAKARSEVDKSIKNDAGNWMPASRMLIPEIGTVIRLEDDWTIDLYHEHRNQALIELIGEGFSYDFRRKSEPGPWQVTIRKGALLTVDRIYIRKGADEFSSLTFILRADGEPTVTYNGKHFECKGKKGFKLFGVSGVVRFWAKLSDVNNMRVSFMKETVKE